MPLVGFWKERTVSPWYPGKINYTVVPVANSATEDQTDILERLASVEAVAKQVHYLGASPCRICGCANGRGEYTYADFIWPSGYAHYLRDHHVAIDPEFKKMLCSM